MKFGIDIPNGWKMSLVDIKDPVEAYEAMTNLVTTGDELGYDSAWVVDHFHTVPTPTQLALMSIVGCITIATSVYKRDLPVTAAFLFPPFLPCFPPFFPPFFFAPFVLVALEPVFVTVTLSVTVMVFSESDTFVVVDAAFVVVPLSLLFEEEELAPEDPLP